MSVLIGRGGDTRALFLYHVRTQRRSSHLQGGIWKRVFRPEPNHDSPDLWLPASRMWENKFLLLSPRSVVFNIASQGDSFANERSQIPSQEILLQGKKMPYCRGTNWHQSQASYVLHFPASTWPCDMGCPFPFWLPDSPPQELLNKLLSQLPFLSDPSWYQEEKKSCLVDLYLTAMLFWFIIYYGSLEHSFPER